MQRTFFDDEHRRDLEANRMARASDSETSHEAADEMVSSGALTSQQQVVLRGLTQHGPATSAELASLMQADRYMVARRLPEIAESGRISRGDPRKCSVTGRRAIVWYSRYERGTSDG